MSTTESVQPVPLQTLELKPELYEPTPAESEFFKTKTGITDDEELKQHIVNVQAEAYKYHPYPCIRGFGFTKLKISRLPGYEDLLKLGKTRPGAIFLDFGCCFGNDVRKAVVDGFPAENALGSDIIPEFWKLGYKLFKDSPDTFPAHFIPGDIFDPALIAPSPPLYTPPSTPRPDLSTLTSLNPTKGHISAIHTSSFFHLFNKADQTTAAKALASLLSPEPGSLIFGAHGSGPVAGVRAFKSSKGNEVWCFPPEEWRALWDGEVFEKGTVSVEAELREIERKGDAESRALRGDKFYFLGWCVRRL